ncbi:hypothetical protein [Mycolicibacterium sp.]|nr:hypothetical protein [Mycolicibacterium sp.]
MRKLIALACLVVLVLTGCARTIDATPVKEPQKVDCDLIFPGPGGA